jgi:hypothetical protein
MDHELDARLARIESSIENLRAEIARQGHSLGSAQELIVQLTEILMQPPDHGESLGPLLQQLVGGLGKVYEVCGQTLAAMTTMTRQIDGMTKTPPS